MKNRIIRLMIGVLLVIPLTGLDSGRAAPIECINVRMVTLPSPAIQLNTSSAPACYRVTIPAGHSLLAVVLERAATSHLFDVFTSEGNMSTFYEWDKDQIKAGSDKMASIYTLVVENQTWSLAITSPERRSLRLHILTYASAKDAAAAQNDVSVLYKNKNQPPVFGGGLINTNSGILSGTVNLASRPGSQVTFPVQLVYHGKIHASLEWTGSATDLALSLYGAGQDNQPKIKSLSKTQVSPGKYRLEWNYQVTNQDVDEGVNWRIQVVNASGGTASGTLNVGYSLQMIPEEISPGKTRNDILKEGRDFLNYVLPVPEGIRRLSIQMTTKADDNFDLFVRRDLPILRGRSDWKSKTAGRQEQVIINNPASGLYYIQVKLSQGSGSFELKAEFQQ